MSVFMQPIYTATVGAGGVGSVTFNNIPQGFTDLKLVVSSRDGRVSNVWDNILVTFNGSNTGYSSQIAYVIDASSSVNLTGRYAGSFSNSFGFALYGSTALNEAGTFSNSELTISNYSGGSHKQVIGESAIPSNSTTLYQLSFHSGVWKNTAPVTSITISPGTGAFAQYSTFTLYGTSSAYSGGIPTAPVLNSVTDNAGFVQVAFTPSANDQSSSYAVTSTPVGATTYGSASPIVTPAAVDTSYVYQVSGVNDRGVSASANSSAITTTNSYSSIASQTVGAGGVSTVVFNNIPQHYSHLQIRMYGFSTSQDTIVRLNNDTTANNYSRYYFYGNGASVTSSGTIQGGNDWIEPLYTSSNTTYAASSVSDIADYSSSVKAKVMRTLSAYDNNGSGFFIMYANSWTGLSPITSLTFSSLIGTFNQYTSIAIYGMA